MWCRWLLLPFSFFYWCGVLLRNLFFEKGILPSTKFSTPIISVGNLSVGGTGKTPFVELLLEHCQRSGKIAVVSRGYGRSSQGTIVVSDGSRRQQAVFETGDEPLQIALKYPEAIVVVDAHRSRGVNKAIELGAAAVILDDGFQHRYVQRDIDVVILPVEDVFQCAWLLPAGNYREIKKSLHRCTYIVLSRCADEREYLRAKEVLKPYRKPTIGVTPVVTAIVDMTTGASLPSEAVSGKRVALLTGIGNPKSFEKTVATLNVRVEYHRSFSDHHWYTNDELTEIVLQAQEQKVDAILTTEKDAMRLRVLRTGTESPVAMYVVRIRQECVGDRENFEQLIETLEQMINRNN